MPFFKFIFALNRTIPQIKESEQELKELLTQSLPQRFHERVHALYLLKSGQAKTRQEVASLLGRHRHTLKNWFDLYESGGLSHLLKLRTCSNNKSHLSPREVEQLKARLAEPEGFASYGDVQDWIKTTFDKSLRYPTVHRLVRYRLQAKLRAFPPF